MKQDDVVRVSDITIHMAATFDDILRRLRDELYETRMTVVCLMPEDIQKLLESYFSCQSRQETYGWESKVVNGIIETAQLLPRGNNSYSSERANCPLCRRGSMSPDESGFTIPEGLRRHLVGWGNTRQCEVMTAAFCLARDYWNDKFSAVEQAEETQKRERLESRKKTEMLYRTAPDDEPRLLDEGIASGTVPRNPSEFVWAECRLAELGFQSTTEANTKSYTSDRGDFVVYADPRAKGQIAFKVYKKPLPKRTRTSRIRRVKMEYFHLMDIWKHGIQGKYETRLGKAMTTLS